MLGEIQKNPLFQVSVVALIVLVSISFFFRSKKPAVVQYNLESAIGYVTMEESARMLGESGGSVVLLLPGSPKEKFRGSRAEGFEKGVREAISKFSNVQLAGSFLTWQALPQNKNLIPNNLTLGTLQAARETYSSATLFISFVGMPRLEFDERAEWLAKTPPKLIAVEDMPGTILIEKGLLEAGVAQVVIRRQDGVTLPGDLPPGNPRELVRQFYTIAASNSISVPRQ